MKNNNYKKYEKLAQDPNNEFAVGELSLDTFFFIPNFPLLTPSKKLWLSADYWVELHSVAFRSALALTLFPEWLILVLEFHVIKHDLSFYLFTCKEIPRWFLHLPLSTSFNFFFAKLLYGKIHHLWTYKCKTERNEKKLTQKALVMTVIRYADAVFSVCYHLFCVNF